VVESGGWTPNKKSADYALMFQNASIAMAVARYGRRRDCDRVVCHALARVLLTISHNYSLDGKFVDCNGAFSIISGYSNDEVMKRSVFDLTPAEDCQELMRCVRQRETKATPLRHAID
jgi:PAS domain-containing protein